MSRREILAMVVLTVSGTVLDLPAARAQLPENIERCLPYPTYAQEVNAMHSTPKPAESADTKSDKTFVIDTVEFDGPITLPEPARRKLIDDLTKTEFHGSPDRPVLDEIAEVSIRGTWQDEGYFTVSDTVTAEDLGADVYRQHIALKVHVDEGLRYTLGKLEFISSDPDVPLVFTTEELRNAFPLKEGDVFDADKIRRSLDAYHKLYGAQGYADFTAEPEFDVNHANQRIGLTLSLDQQKQFHITTIQVDNSDARIESILRSMMKPGDLFDYDVLEKFFEENKSELPPNASIDESVHMQKNVKDGTVSMRFDFFTCPDSVN
jgi:outer membrane translocation and assembly module TamA